MGNKVERRFLAPQVRAESQGEEGVLVGYAATYGMRSGDLGGFFETVAPTAFLRSLREGAPVVALVNHDPTLVLAHTRNKTLSLETDARGLKFRCILPPTQNARDAYALVKRGDVVGCSFSFITRKDTWSDQRDANGDLYANRQLDDVDLLDVSPVVTFPAYDSTAVLARQKLFPDGEPEELRAALDRRYPGRKHQEGNIFDEDELRRIRLRILAATL